MKKDNIHKRFIVRLISLFKDKFFNYVELDKVLQRSLFPFLIKQFNSMGKKI